MDVYLIQTNGADIDTTANAAYVASAEGPRLCDELLTHQRYFNAESYWQQGLDWEGEGARLEFGDVIELDSLIAYSTILTQLDRGNFSDGMADCGREGFNFRRVELNDLETIQYLFPPITGTWDKVL